MAEAQAAVQREEPVAAKPPQRQHAAEQDAAVAPQYQQEGPRAQQLLDPVGKPDGERWDGGAVARAGQRVELGAVGRRLDPASVDRA